MAGQEKTWQQARGPRFLLPLLCAASFSLAFSSSLISPLLPEIAAELRVPVALAGQLATASMATGAVAALVMGILSDTYGRRGLLSIGVAAAGLSALGLAIAPSFTWALAFRAVAGFGYVMSVVLAAAGDWFIGDRRDRAAARILTADALATIVGIPILAIIAQAAGWRAGVAMVGILILGVSGLLLIALPEDRRWASSLGLREVLASALADQRRQPGLGLALAANAARNAFWMSFVTFAGALLVDNFSLQTWQLGPVLAFCAIAFVVGIELGGWIAGRARPRSIVATACLLGGAMVPLLSGLSNLALAAGPIIVFCICGGIATSGLVAAVLRRAPESRGMAMAINSALCTVGAAAGSALGGLGIAIAGYRGLGVTAAGLAIIATICTFRMEPTPYNRSSINRSSI